jgi:hypothetical protein
MATKVGMPETPTHPRRLWGAKIVSILAKWHGLQAKASFRHPQGCGLWAET